MSLPYRYVVWGCPVFNRKGQGREKASSEAKKMFQDTRTRS